MEKIMDSKKWRNLAIAVIIFALGWVMPGMGAVTKDGMFALGSMISLIFAMASGVEAWYVLLLIITFSIKNKLNITQNVFPEAFGSYIMWFIILSFWYMAGVAKTGFLDFITKKLLGLRISRKGPYWLMSLLFVSAFVATALTQSVLAVLFIMMAVLRGIQKSLDLKVNDKWLVCAGVGIGACILIGSVYMPFNFSFFMYGGIMAQTFGWVRNVNAGAYLIHQTVGGVIAIVLMVVVTKYIVRPKLDFASLSGLELTSGENQKFDKSMGVVIITILILVVAVGITSFLTVGSGLFDFFSRFGITAGFALSCVLLMFIKNSKGERCLDFGKVLSENTHWSMLFYIGAIVYVGNFISAGESGIMAQFASWFTPLRNLSPIILIGILGILANLLTNATNNMVVAMLLCPIAYSVLGMESSLAQAATVAIIVGSLSGNALPGSSTVGIVQHTYKDLYTSGKFIAYGYLFAILICIGQLIGLLLAQGIY